VSAGSLTLSHKQTADFELLANGGFAPLEGFQGSEAWKTFSASRFRSRS
jgi:ATP sulfurylase